ncbi:hypothetical protein A1F94_001252 [Pyrenophora tritici-repentis]|nr:hypothetical protein A1F94_001252 [Pyrenophora tritici-repentis]
MWIVKTWNGLLDDLMMVLQIQVILSTYFVSTLKTVQDHRDLSDASLKT